MKKKRQMMFIPEVNPKSFVFFFERNNGKSWSIRDYSLGGDVKPKVYRPNDLRWAADEIHLKAKHSFDAETISTDDLAYWHKHTLELNQKYL